MSTKTARMLMALLTMVMLVTAAPSVASAQAGNLANNGEDGEALPFVINGEPVQDLQGELSTVPLFDTEAGFAYCSGVVIGPRHVLTASHCVTPEAAPQVTTPSNLVGIAEPLGFNEDGSIGYSFALATQVTVHPAWDYLFLNLATVDLAIIEVDRNMVTSPAGLMYQGYAPLDLANLRAGWGLTRKFPESTPSTVLSKADMQVYPSMVDGRCATDTVGFGAQMSNLICGPSQGASVCNGDSGGPLWSRDAAGIMRVQGISSWGAILCQSDSYWVNVTQNIDWILAQTGPLLATVASAPIDLRTVSGDGTVTLTWDSSNSGGSPVTDYHITVLPIGVEFVVAADGRGTYSFRLDVENLDGIRFIAEVAAVNAIGVGGSTYQDFESRTLEGGYWLVDGHSRDYAFGDAVNQRGGSLTGSVISTAGAADGNGYSTLRGTGEVVPRGDLTW
ncbi:MAG: trypsin [Candidatus Poriferisodalaceae bacterium]|jgi:trypsin